MGCDFQRSIKESFKKACAGREEVDQPEVKFVINFYARK